MEERMREREKKEKDIANEKFGNKVVWREKKKVRQEET